jgi:hypothetical protein
MECPDLIFSIIIHLGIEDILRLSLVSKRIRKILLDGHLLRLFATTKYKFAPSHVNWRNLYRQEQIEYFIDRCLNRHWPALIENQQRIRLHHGDDDYIAFSPARYPDWTTAQQSIRLTPISAKSSGFYLYIEQGAISSGATYPGHLLETTIRNLLQSEVLPDELVAIGSNLPEDAICLIDIVSYGQDTTYNLVNPQNDID